MASGCAILRLRGLPYSASEKDLRDFFDGFEVVATHISLRNGKPTGEAYVQFASPEEAAKALKKRNHEHMGNRYIEIFESLEAGLVAKSLAPTGAAGGAAAAPSLQGHVVRLRGLPFASTAQDVLQFFKDIDVVGGESGVIFTCTPDGRPAGEAYVEVASGEAKAVALAKHKEKMGSRYIEIFDSSKGDMYQAVQQHGCFTAVGGKRRHHWPAGGAGGQHAAQQSGGGQYGDMGPGRGGRPQQGHGMEEMAAAFAGFGISPHDIQVPGPPRGTFIPFGGPPIDDNRQYGARPGPQGPMGGMPSHWRPLSQQVPGPNHPGARPQQFSRAPGPPSGKGGNGGRQHQGGGSGGSGLYDYGATPPLMMQAPFMLQPPPFMHPQQPGSPWAAAMMASAQQQGGGWYGAGMAGPQGRGGPLPLGMAGPYTTFGPGYYVRSPGMSPPPHMGTPPGPMPLSAHPGYPRTPPPSGANASGGGGGGGGGAHNLHHPHHPAGSSVHSGAGGDPVGPAGSVPVAPAPVSVVPPAQQQQQEQEEEEVSGPRRAPTPGSLSGGIGGRGDSSHSLTGLINAPPRPDSAPPQHSEAPLP